MTPWNRLHKLPTLMFKNLKNLFGLRYQKWSGDATLRKKPSEHI